jgi:threonine synthase
MPELKPTHCFECSDCGTIYRAEDALYLCPACSKHNRPELPPKGVLKTLYDYEKLQRILPDFDTLVKRNWLDLLPLQDLTHWPRMRIGQTPLYRVDPPDGRVGGSLWLKDDSQNPSYSFKDRASALVSAFAAEKGWNTLVTASTGNAGSSMAAICAGQQQRAIVLVPAAAPKAKLMQISLYGARLVPVKGTYDDAFGLSIKASEHFGWYNRNTAFNPLTIEGKKTVAFEIYQQFGQNIPDYMYVPTGDGVIISGVYKGFEDLLKLGWIEKLPIVIAVQSENSDNLVRNRPGNPFYINATGSIADSITVGVPQNFYMTHRFLEEYGGQCQTVSDASILEASSLLARRYGLFAEPAAAAALAGYLEFNKNLKTKRDAVHLVLLTGSGLKDIDSMLDFITLPSAIEPDLDKLKKIIHD